MEKAPIPQVDIVPLDAELETTDRAAVLEELRTLAPNAHAVTTNTADAPIRLALHDRPLTASAAIRIFSGD